MSGAGRYIVIELDGPRLSALRADVKSGTIHVRAWHAATCPSSVDRTDEKALLAWASGELKSWKLGRGRLVCSVPRAEVVLKRLHLTGAAAASDDDRAGIVSLQMGRQLSLSMQEPVVDYVPMRDDGDAPVLDVLAGALPSSRLEWLRSLARATGLKLHRVGLRSEGVGTLVAGASPDDSGAVLGVGIGASTTDFVVVEHGELRFARSADTGRDSGSSEPARIVEQVAVEAKRTWMSYRMASDSLSVERVVALGQGAIAEGVVERCGRELELPASAIESPSLIEYDEEIGRTERAASMALVGLVAQEVLGAQTLNFASPRRAADTSAATRQRALVGVFALIVIAGGAYLFATSELQSLERERKRLAGEQAELLEAYYDALRRRARAEHAEHFMETGVDWIAHLRWLSETMPDPNDALANQFRASMEPSVTFSPRVVEDEQGRRAVRFTGGRWSHAQRVGIVIEGEVRSRPIADALRSRLLDSGVYSVETRGPDDERSFSFQLISSVADPLEGGQAAVASTEGAP